MKFRRGIKSIRDTSASDLCRNDDLQVVAVWRLHLHTLHTGVQLEGKHRLHILLE